MQYFERSIIYNQQEGFNNYSKSDQSNEIYNIDIEEIIEWVSHPTILSGFATEMLSEIDSGASIRIIGHDKLDNELDIEINIGQINPPLLAGLRISPAGKHNPRSFNPNPPVLQASIQPTSTQYLTKLM